MAQRGWGEMIKKIKTAIKESTNGKLHSAMGEHLSIASDVRLGANVKLSKFINLYGCTIGDNTKIGAFVEIQKNARIGKNCKISGQQSLGKGVENEDGAFYVHRGT